MILNYAGIPLLLEDPGGEVQAFVDRHLSLPDTQFFASPQVFQHEGRQRPRGNAAYKVGLPTPNWSAMPRPKLNTLWWPTGASRFAIGLFVAEGFRLREILTTIANEGRDYQDLVIADEMSDERGVRVPMWMLPPWEIQSAGRDEALYVLPLVDQRYFWQFIDVGGITVTSATSWEGLLSSLRNQLYAELDFSPPFSWDDYPAAYGQPDPAELTRKYENFAGYLDAVAFCLGQRVIADFDGSINLVTWTTSDARRQTNFDRLTQRTYGDLTVAGSYVNEVHFHRRGKFPRQMRVVFPRSSGGDVYEITVPGSDFLPEEAFTFQATKTFYNTAIATGSSGAPTNQTQLEDLTRQIARDYYDSLYNEWDVAIAGTEPWVQTGWDDAVFFHAGFREPTGEGADGPYRCHTRITTFPPDFGICELLHQPNPASSSSSSSSSSTSASSQSSQSSESSQSSDSNSSLSSGSSLSSSSSSSCATGTFSLVTGIECCNGQLYVRTRSITIYPNGTFCFGADDGPFCPSSSSSSSSA